MTKPLRNQNGSAMSSLLALLPLIISIIATLGSIFLLIHQVQKSAYICRSQVLDTQDQMLTQMQKLTALNPAATELRIERIAANHGVHAATAWPPALAAAEAYLASVVVRQAALGASQNALIIAGNMKAQMAQQRLRGEVSLLPGVHTASAQTAKMQVKAQQQDTPTPDYKPTDAIERDQTMQLTWSVHPLEFLPQWIRDLFDKKDFAIQSTCASRPKQNNQTGGTQWSAILKKDKP